MPKVLPVGVFRALAALLLIGAWVGAGLVAGFDVPPWPWLVRAAGDTFVAAVLFWIGATVAALPLVVLLRSVSAMPGLREDWRSVQARGGLAAGMRRAGAAQEAALRGTAAERRRAHLSRAAAVAFLGVFGLVTTGLSVGLGGTWFFVWALAAPLVAVVLVPWHLVQAVRAKDPGAP